MTVCPQSLAPSPIMTERERWIVYPLLFLALGAALRDKLVDRTTTKSIVCQELTIVDEEVPGLHSQRTLAKIGTIKVPTGGKSVGYIQLNGDVTIVDDDLARNPPPRVLAKLGRSDPLPTAPSAGYAMIQGGVVIDGIVNAQQYFFKGFPIIPLPLVPGVAMPNVSPAIPHGVPKVPNPTPSNANPPSPPPATKTKKDQEAAQPPSPAGDAARPLK
jgi:hypothetical protein